MTAANWSATTDIRWPWRRLLPALVASATAHYLIVEGWSPSGGMPAGVAQPLRAQLEMAAAAMPEKPETESLTEPVIVPAPMRPRQTQQISAGVAEPEPNTPEAQRVAAPDPRVYPARELDRFPAPLLPLDLRTGSGRSGIARFWVSIDGMGNVVDVDSIPGDLPAAQSVSAREWLLGVRFTPAFKDERPVKSRIMLELSYGP